jgi:AcrR family transcriptional regulator
MTARTTYHHGDLRASLLEEAERTIAGQGAERLSLRELARAVGVSHSAPRRHFPSRQALLDALAVSGFQRLGDQVDEAMRRRDGMFAGRLTAFAQAYVRFATRHPALLEVMFGCLHRPDADPEVRAANDAAFAGPLELIAEARARGDIVSGDPDQVATAILATLQGLAALAGSAMLAGQKPTEAAVSDTIRILVDGLRPR